MGVETAMLIGSAAASGVTAVGSFTQAAKQKKLANQAAQDAEKAIAAARAKLDVNYYEQLAVPREAYELEREALLSSGAQAIQAGVESERGAAATAGRIQMAQSDAQAGQRTAMAKELADLAKLTATEESRLRDLKTDLDISEAKAERLRERDANRARAAAIQQGFAGVTGMLQTAAPLIPLYLKQSQAETPEDMQSMRIQSVGTEPMQSDLYRSDMGNMSESDMQDMLSKMTPEQKAEFFKKFGDIFQNPFAIK